MTKISRKGLSIKDDKQKEIAKKALQEAKDRKKLEIKKIRPKELKGPKGPEPTRYGDWEKKGITYDF